jgi:ComF family protein
MLTRSDFFSLCQYIYEQMRISAVALLYPQNCLHCYSRELQQGEILCPLCSERLVLLREEGRCRRFFSLMQDGQRECYTCRQLPGSLLSASSAFDYADVAATLVKKLKYSSLDYLSIGMGGFIVAQLLRQEWPLPDYVIPAPIAAAHLLSRGYNQSALLAESVGKLLDRPVCDALGRYSGDYSQAGLSRQQRLALSDANFVIKGRPPITGRTVLLIDDVWTTGQTLNCCVNVLAREHPKAIYALTFCRTFD